MIFLNPPRERSARRKKKRPPPPENDEGLCMGILQTALNMSFIVLVFLIGSTKGKYTNDTQTSNVYVHVSSFYVFRSNIYLIPVEMCVDLIYQRIDFDNAYVMF